jgi:hypothetical protein
MPPAIQPAWVRLERVWEAAASLHFETTQACIQFLPADFDEPQSTSNAAAKLNRGHLKN